MSETPDLVEPTPDLVEPTVDNVVEDQRGNKNDDKNIRTGVPRLTTTSYCDVLF